MRSLSPEALTARLCPSSRYRPGSRQRRSPNTGRLRATSTPSAAWQQRPRALYAAAGTERQRWRTLLVASRPTKVAAEPCNQRAGSPPATSVCSLAAPVLSNFGDPLNLEDGTDTGEKEDRDRKTLSIRNLLFSPAYFLSINPSPCRTHLKTHVLHKYAGLSPLAVLQFYLCRIKPFGCTAILHLLLVNDYMFKCVALCNPYSICKWYSIIFAIKIHIFCKIKYQLIIN